MPLVENRLLLCFYVTVKCFAAFSPCHYQFSATQNCAICFHRRKKGEYIIVYRRMTTLLTAFVFAALTAEYHDPTL